MAYVERTYQDITEVFVTRKGWEKYNLHFLGDLHSLRVEYIDYNFDGEEVGNGIEEFYLERYLKVIEVELSELIRNEDVIAEVIELAELQKKYELGQKITTNKGITGIIIDINTEKKVYWIENSEDTWSVNESDILEVKPETIQTTFAQYINTNKYNQVFTSDIEKFSSELLSIMIAKEGEVRRTGQDFGGWNYEVINNRILILELGAWRYGQKIKWDMEKNCLADGRKKEYRELIRK